METRGSVTTGRRRRNCQKCHAVVSADDLCIELAFTKKPIGGYCGIYQWINTMVAIVPPNFFFKRDMYPNAARCAVIIVREHSFASAELLSTARP
jgi:hypothetical protein